MTDESGAVLPGVTVTATQTDRAFVRAVTTDGADWVMTNMPTGPYRLEVSLQGFRTYVQAGIVLQVGATPTLNTSLAVGSLEETVSVEAAAPIVNIPVRASARWSKTSGSSSCHCKGGKSQT